MHKNKQTFYSGKSRYQPPTFGDNPDQYRGRNFMPKYFDDYMNDSPELNVSSYNKINPELSFISRDDEDKSIEQKVSKNFITSWNSEECQHQSFDQSSNCGDDLNKSI